MREAVEKNPNMSEKEARDLIDKCMKILHYRDGRSFNRVSTSEHNSCNLDAGFLSQFKPTEYIVI